MIVKSTFLLLLALSFVATRAEARIDLSVLQADGYGVVDLKRPEPNVLTVTANINGHKATLIVDTGALTEGIALESDQLRALGAVATADRDRPATSATGKKVALKTARADRVVIGNVEISGVPLVVGSMQALRRPTNYRSVGADGLLGAYFLRTCSAVIDLHNLRLYLRPPGHGRRVDLAPALHAAGLAEARIGEKCVVDVALNDTPGKMILDTGAFLATADVEFAYKAGASVAGSRVGVQDVTGEISRTSIAHLKSFKIGGVPVRAPDLRLAKFPFYKETGGVLVGLLGIDILGSNGAIIDFGQLKLYFYPAQQ